MGTVEDCSIGGGWSTPLQACCANTCPWPRLLEERNSFGADFGYSVGERVEEDAEKNADGATSASSLPVAPPQGREEMKEEDGHHRLEGGRQSTPPIRDKHKRGHNGKGRTHPPPHAPHAPPPYPPSPPSPPPPPRKSLDHVERAPTPSAWEPPSLLAIRAHNARVAAGEVPPRTRLPFPRPPASATGVGEGGEGTAAANESLAPFPQRWLKSFTAEELHRSQKKASKHAAHVVDAMRTTWRNYHSSAFGADDFNPLTGEKANDWAGVGVMVYESLDTLWLMGLTEEFNQVMR
eukprot:GHVU01138183.1.p1 GENE.GHVU01138183.1~~GHVU01138183.1.p1  ORF type:complete len:306 (+),score=46.03 GHVU01138183.1:41-919(+)